MNFGYHPIIVYKNKKNPKPKDATQQGTQGKSWTVVEKNENKMLRPAHLLSRFDDVPRHLLLPRGLLLRRAVSFCGSATTRPAACR